MGRALKFLSPLQADGALRNLPFGTDFRPLGQSWQVTGNVPEEIQINQLVLYNFSKGHHLQFTTFLEIQQSFFDTTSSSMRYKQASKFVAVMTKFKDGAWSFGVLFLLFEITNRDVTSFADGYLSTIDLLQLFIASLLFVTWLYLKPKKSLSRSNIALLQSHQFNSDSYQDKKYICTAKSRMIELQEQHVISQEYVLSVPYLCQVYHLLNLKHLESIHNFSLNNLRIIEVSDFQSTAMGGTLKFKTTLDSPVNALRIWRQPIAEIGLTLHTPYTIELSIPAYNHKKIAVIFNALPLSNTEHKLFIDIYSDLKWPKLFLQILLHAASCITLFEDLPYLHKLAERNISHLVSLGRGSDHETMWLLRRFVELYGLSLDSSQPIKLESSQDRY